MDIEGRRGSFRPAPAVGALLLLLAVASSQMPARRVDARVLKTGSIRVTKLVAADAGFVPPANAAFPVTVRCKNPALPVPDGHVTLQANQSFQFTNIPVWSTCTTSEQLPPPVAVPGCSRAGWTSIITPNPVTIPPTGAPTTVTVTNHFGCLNGTVLITKTVVNSTPPLNAPPAMTFGITVYCTNSLRVIPDFHATLSANGSATTNNIEPTSTCTTGEAALPPPVTHPACPQLIGWSAPVIAPNPVAIPAAGGVVSVTVTITYGCLKPQAGSIVVNKIVEAKGQPAAFTAWLTFDVTVHCTNGSLVIPDFHATLSGGGSATFVNIPANSTCTASEAPPVSTSARCGLLTLLAAIFSPNPVIIPAAGGAVTMTVTNKVHCSG
jgi:uncharacterized protein DUF5979